jgi:hypothetical protein
VESFLEFFTHDLPGRLVISQLLYECVLFFCFGIAPSAAWGPDLGEYVWRWLGVLAILLHSEKALWIGSDVDWSIA